MDRMFKGLLIILLAGILTTLIAIYIKMPTTLGELRDASGVSKKELLDKQMVVYVSGGSVDVNNVYGLR